LKFGLDFPAARRDVGNDLSSECFRKTRGFERFEDLIAAGVIDPAWVTRYAMQNAAMIASLMPATEAVIWHTSTKKLGTVHNLFYR
jgi:chaperonin GroEL (HSP60 family)